MGLSNYLYKIARSAYYNRLFVRHFLINQRLQVKIARRLAKTIVKTLRKLDVDLIQAEQDIAILTGLEVKKGTGLPFLVDLHNITSEELVASHVIAKDSLEFNALQQLFGKTLQQADSVAVVSDEMQDYVATNFDVPSRHIIVVPPGGRPRIDEVEMKSFPPKIVYSGLVAYREHVDLFVESAPMVSDEVEEAKFYITRKGDALGGINRIAKSLRVNVSYFWYPDAIDFYEFLSSCHVGALPSSNDLARKMGTPVKLFDYLSVGLPVVANDVGSWTRVIKDEKVGITTADTPADFASGILELIQDRELAQGCERRALELVKNKYNWDNSAKVLLSEYTHLVSQ
jgi:glycosyltransferase involved in cell wall biosynthesis